MFLLLLLPLKVVWPMREVRDKRATRTDWTKAILGFDEVLKSPDWLVCWLAGEQVEVGPRERNPIFAVLGSIL